jgi:hypothetical protein
MRFNSESTGLLGTAFPAALSAPITSTWPRNIQLSQSSALQVLARLMAGDEFDETRETCVERDSEGNASQLGRIDLLQLDPERD